MGAGYTPVALAAAVFVRSGAERSARHLHDQSLAGRSLVGTAHNLGIGAATHNGIAAIESCLGTERRQRGEVALEAAAGRGQTPVGEWAELAREPRIPVATLREPGLDSPGGAVEQVACPLPSLSQLRGRSKSIECAPFGDQFGARS